MKNNATYTQPIADHLAIELIDALLPIQDGLNAIESIALSLDVAKDRRAIIYVTDRVSADLKALHDQIKAPALDPMEACHEREHES